MKYKMGTESLFTSAPQEIAHQLQECALICHQAFTLNAPKEAGMNLAHIHLKRLLACSAICESTARLLVKEGIEMERLCAIAARICQHLRSGQERFFR